MSPVSTAALAPVARSRSHLALSIIALRLRVYLTRGGLDRRIAAGDERASTPAVALRARPLADVRTRRKVASELRRVVAHADRVASRTRLSAVLVEPTQVRAGREAILGLAELIERPTSADPRGVALARELLSDPASPLFDRGCRQTVADAVCEVETALVAGSQARGGSGPASGD